MFGKQISIITMTSLRSIGDIYRVMSEPGRIDLKTLCIDPDSSSAEHSLRNCWVDILNLDPELVTIAYGPYGKPTLKEEQNPDQIQFNLSHANELALYAFSIDRKLGIDLEFIHWIPDFDRIAARSFSKNEYRIWDALPDAVKKLAFYRCWTRKEAFVKAVGDGFSFPLDQFEVSLCPGEPPQLIRIETAPFEAARWSYGELPGIPGCTTALIVEENDWNLACFDHQP